MAWYWHSVDVVWLLLFVMYMPTEVMLYNAVSVENRLGTLLIEVKRINLMFFKYLESIKNIEKKKTYYYFFSIFYR
jgi:hypothetical protein